MKVLVIPTWYPNGEDKLMGIYHKEFTQALNDYGIEANMLFIDRQRLNNPLKYLLMKKKIIDHEINYTVYIYRMLNISPINFDLQMKSYVKKMKKAFKDYLKANEKPDIIHAHVTVPAGFAALQIGKQYNIPVVVTEHCGNLERFYKNYSLKKYGLKVLDETIYTTVSKYMKNIVLNYTDKCDIIPNFVDIHPFKNNINRKITKEFKLLSVSALREGKKLDIAFKAIDSLKKQNIPVHLDIIGDGFYENYFKSVCKDLKLENEVSFLGRKNKLEIAEIMKKEHCLLISSELESFGIPGIEAMASGLPVISTKCLGPEEYINKKNGLLCEVNNPESMAESIIKMYHNYHLYNKNDSIKTAEKYSKEEVIKNTIKLYEEHIKNTLN